MSNEIPPSSSFWSRLGRAFRRILRSLLVLMIIVGMIAAVYYGAPYLYNNFILPVENNTARLREVESKQAADANLLATQVAGLKTRLTDLETRQTENAQALAELQGQVAALETTLNTHTESLKQLESMQASLDALATASAEHESLLVGEDSALADLQRQVALSRSIELLSRARLYLSQSNLGLAKQDVGSAREMLLSLQADMPDEKTAVLQDVITNLDLALDNLPAFPVVAMDNINIAWELLVNGLPEQPQETPTPEPVTGTPLPTVDVTPTATP
jgi:uncharacterized coiled-coil protein SlyX